MKPWHDAPTACLLLVLPLGTGCDCGQTHILTDSGPEPTTSDAARVCPDPGRPVPESLGPCTEARSGEEVCSGSSGAGFYCFDGCWRLFVDGPCSPRDAGSLRDAAMARLDAAEPRADAGACPSPPAIDELGATCSPDGSSCPFGYTCQAFSGAVLAHSCQILCELDGCPCPAGTRCVERADKVSTWHQCDPLEG